MPPLDMRHMMRFQSASVAERCVKLAEGMLTVAGGGGVYDTSNMGRIYRNMLTGRQHAAAQYLDAVKSLDPRGELLPDPQYWVKQSRTAAEGQGTSTVYELRVWGRCYASRDRAVIDAFA